MATDFLWVSLRGATPDVDLFDLMIKGGLKAPQKRRIRDEIWIKLLGNCSFNPVSVLTGASLDQIEQMKGAVPLFTRLCRNARRLRSSWCPFCCFIEERIEGVPDYWP